MAFVRRRLALRTQDRDVTKMLGYSARRIRSLAVAGNIPGAFRIGDTSGWRFDHERLLAWIEELKAETQQQASWSDGGNVSLDLERGTTMKEYERAIGRLYAFQFAVISRGHR